MEISHVELFVIDNLHQHPELRCRKFLRQKVEDDRTVVVSLASYGLQSLGYYQVVVKGKATELIEPLPFGHFSVDCLFKCLVKLTSEK